MSISSPDWDDLMYNDRLKVPAATISVLLLHLPQGLKVYIPELDTEKWIALDPVFEKQEGLLRRYELFRVLRVAGIPTQHLGGSPGMVFTVPGASEPHFDSSGRPVTTAEGRSKGKGKGQRPRW